MDARRKLGDLGEEEAVRHLERLGYEILDRNFRTRYGELDIVSSTASCLVFCEVKTRTAGGSAGPATALEAVGDRAFFSFHRPNDDADRFRRIAFDVLQVPIELGAMPAAPVRLTKDGTRTERADGHEQRERGNPTDDGRLAMRHVDSSHGATRAQERGHGAAGVRTRRFPGSSSTCTSSHRAGRVPTRNARVPRRNTRASFWHSDAIDCEG